MLRAQLYKQWWREKQLVFVVHLLFVFGLTLLLLSLFPMHVQARWAAEPEQTANEQTEIVDWLKSEEMNIYFGVDNQSILTLFEGLPYKGKVIRSFFQLDIEHMKSSLPPQAVRQLYDGIRVSDLAEYNSVLSTYSDFVAKQTNTEQAKLF